MARLVVGRICGCPSAPVLRGPWSSWGGRGGQGRRAGRWV